MVKRQVVAITAITYSMEGGKEECIYGRAGAGDGLVTRSGCEMCVDPVLPAGHRGRGTTTPLPPPGQISSIIFLEN